MPTGFERYNKEVREFEKSKLFKDKYDAFIFELQAAYKPLLSPILERKLSISGVQVRALAAHARCKREPITSDQDGYGYARRFKDFEPTIKHMTERRDKLSFIISQMKKALPDKAQGELL